MRRYSSRKYAAIVVVSLARRRAGNEVKFLLQARGA
jgi:hypothetical protein